MNHDTSDRSTFGQYAYPNGSYGSLRRTSGLESGSYPHQDGYGSRATSVAYQQPSPPLSGFTDEGVARELERRLRSKQNVEQEFMQGQEKLQSFKSFMSTPSSQTLAESAPFHRYTIHVVDLLTGAPSKKMATTILDNVIRNHPDIDFPDHSIPLGNRNLRVTMEKVQSIPLKGYSRVGIEDTVMLTEMIESSDDEDLERHRDAYIQVPAGSRKKVTGDSRRFVRFSELKVQRVDSSNLSRTRTPEQLQNELLDITGYLKFLDEQTSHFAIWIQHEKIDLKDISQTLARAAEEGQAFEETQSTFIGQTLRDILVSKFPDMEHDIVIRKNCVFAGFKSQERGLEQKYGLQGKIVYHQDGSPHLHWKPCVASFFQPSRVSDFLDGFFGPIASIGLPARLKKQATSLLIDAQVVVTLPNVANDEKKKVAIAGLGESLLSNPQVLHRTFGNATVETLKFPGMPTMNIGTAAKPVYCPAEYCLFLGSSQYLRNEPLPEEASKSQRTYESKFGDPFPEYNPRERGFNLVFANLGHTQGAPAAGAQMLSDFKSEIGRRYNRKLDHAVEHSKSVQSTVDKFLNGGLSTLLHERQGYYPGIDMVVFVVVPDDTAKDKITQLRQNCDIQHGVQCCIINGSEIVKRAHPLHKKDMVMYTGEIVKKLFARAKIPAGGRSAIEPNFSSVVGVHVSKFQDFRVFKNDFLDAVTNKPDDHKAASAASSYMVNIVSASSNDPRYVRTTTHVFAADARDGLFGLANQISSCLCSHLEKCNGAQFSIYLSGLRSVDRDFVTSLWYKMDGWLPHKEVKVESQPLAVKKPTEAPKVPRSKASRRSDSFHADDADPITLLEQDFPDITLPALRNSLVCYVPEPKVSLTTGITRKVASSGNDISPEDFQRIHDDVVGIVFKYPQAPSNTSQSMRVTYILETSGPKHDSLDTLETKPLPAILHLAQKASERSQLHVFVKTHDPEAQQPACPYGLRQIHSDLDGTFYFL